MNRLFMHDSAMPYKRELLRDERISEWLARGIAVALVVVLWWVLR